MYSISIYAGRDGKGERLHHDQLATSVLVVPPVVLHIPMALLHIDSLRREFVGTVNARGHHAARSRSPFRADPSPANEVHSASMQTRRGRSSAETFRLSTLYWSRHEMFDSLASSAASYSFSNRHLPAERRRLLEAMHLVVTLHNLRPREYAQREAALQAWTPRTYMQTRAFHAGPVLPKSEKLLLSKLMPE